MKYQWILFDADETLYSFNSYLGLRPMLQRYGIEFNQDDYARFQAVNKPLWVAYQNKEISAKEIQIRRFAELSKQTGKHPLELNQELMTEMAIVSVPLSGVIDTLSQLKNRVKMGIITNGFTALQQQRLENTNTAHFFEFLIVSEQVGVAKPDKKIFESAFALMGEFDKSQVLMVGDTLTSDILGGNNVGIDTCWFNHSLQNNDTLITPTYEISHFEQLIDLVQG